MTKLTILWAILGITFGFTIASTGVRGLHSFILYFSGIIFGIVSHILFVKIEEKNK